MSYLYGDSSPSTLKINFIDFLKDALDFSVQVLAADRRIREGGERAVEARRAGEGEVTRLEALGAQIAHAVDGAALGEANSPTARCADSVLRSSAELVRGEIDRVRAGVAADQSKVDAQAAGEREQCMQALGALLMRHDLPEWSIDLRLEQQGGQRYVAWLTGHAPFGLDATLELEVPPTHLMAHVLRVDKLVERLEVHAPEEGGWIRKEVKLRPQRLEKEYLTEVRITGEETTLSLRANADGSGAGFDLSVRAEAPRVRLKRVGEGASTDAAPFELSDADAQRVVELQEKLVLGCAELAPSRKRLADARLDGKPLSEHAEPRVMAERLIETITPTVQEIGRRSLTPTELVLKRQLDGGRREEIFVSRDELRLKLAPLSDAQRALFAPLGLADPATGAPAKAATSGAAKAAPSAAARTPSSDSTPAYESKAAHESKPAQESKAAHESKPAPEASKPAPSEPAPLPSRRPKPTPAPVPVALAPPLSSPEPSSPAIAVGDDEITELRLDAPIPGVNTAPPAPPQVFKPK